MGRNFGRVVAVGAALAGSVAYPGEVQAFIPMASTTLTMAVADTGGPTPAAVAFARDVDRLSHGALLITFRIPAQQTADGEAVVLRDVEQGAVPLGLIPTRAWDVAGVSSFAALQAPFLITDYALLKKVLDGPVGRGMLAGTRKSGVRTLGLMAYDLHVPLGAQRPFVKVSDFRGAILRVPSNSPLTAAILEALGGKAASIASGPELFAALKSGAVDGAISSIGFTLLNGYYGAAKYLTTNLVFFPRVDSVGINEHAFEALTPHQRAILTAAAVATTPKSSVGLSTRDQQNVGILCRTGLRIANSTAAQIAALRRAEQPVYAYLETNRATAVRIAKIQVLKKKTKPTRPLAIPKGCAA
jgi:TRAP-type transport system periplasmic protein